MRTLGHKSPKQLLAEKLAAKIAVFALLFRSATLHSKGGQKHYIYLLLYFLPKMCHIYLQRRFIFCKKFKFGVDKIVFVW